jgi:hypothetical protein
MTNSEKDFNIVQLQSAFIFFPKGNSSALQVSSKKAKGQQTYY